MRARLVIAVLGVLTVIANLLLGVGWLRAVVAGMAGVVVVLRFPLCLLYAVICLYIQNISDFYLLLFNRSDMKGCSSGVVRPAYHNWVILTRVSVL